MSGEAQTSGNTNLKRQDLSQLDITTLTPLSPEVISRQATINVGTIGHVAHGKSTVVKAISGVHTVRFKNELERNITIKLERISDEHMLALTSSPQILREFLIEQQRTFIPSPYSIHESYEIDSKLNSRSRNNNNNNRNKRRSSSTDQHTIKRKRTSLRSTAENDAARKHAKILEFLGIGPNTQMALRLNGYDRTEVTPSPSTSSDVITRNLSYSDTDSILASSPVHDAMKDLHILHILLHDPEQVKGQSSSRTKKSKKTNTTATVENDYVHEYVVQKIVELNIFKPRGKLYYLPQFNVKWKGYPDNENTWELCDNVYDCQAFTDFMQTQYEIHRNELDQVWEELIAASPPTLPPLTDCNAITKIAKFNYFHLQSDLIALVYCNYNPRWTKEKENIYSRCKATMRLLPYYLKRFEQLRDIFVWQVYINECDKSSNLRIENNVDFEVPPRDFTYMNDVLPGKDVFIPNEPPIGCECTDDGKCNKKSECCGSESTFAYNSNRSICVNQGTPIFECNKRCKCGPDCVNRVMQQGRKHSLCIFKTANGCGWGVRTDRAIAKGQYVCEYVGEVITYEETERRGKIYDADGRTYLFDLDFNGNDNPYSIDAAKCGNVSHFINHSCDPNLGVWAVWSDCLDRDLPKIGLFTLRNITAGEEITFDYTNQNSNRDRDMTSASESSTAKPATEAASDYTDENSAKEIKTGKIAQERSEMSETITISSDEEIETSPKLKRFNEQTECKCGAANCRKFLF